MTPTFFLTWLPPLQRYKLQAYWRDGLVGPFHNTRVMTEWLLTPDELAALGDTIQAAFADTIRAALAQQAPAQPEQEIAQ